MKSNRIQARVLGALAAFFFALLAWTDVLSQEQLVSGSFSVSELRENQSTDLTITYSATNSAKTSGLGLRLHYDSSTLEMGPYRDRLRENAQPFQIQNDVSDFDDNPSTDKLFLTSWADTSGDGWPYAASQPVILYVVRLTAKVDFDGAILGFTGFSTPGYTLVANDITIVKAEAPVITLTGSAEVSLELGSTYTDAGVTAVDNIDGDITSSIVTVNPVDANTVGTYTVTYNVSDAAGNAAVQVARLVNIGGTIDIDGNAQYDALTDGLLLLRSMFGLDGNALTSGAIASDATYVSSAEVESQIATLGALIDIDGNGQIDALTDGLLILRYLFGLEGDVLIHGVVASGATRATAVEIEAHLAALMPAL